MVVVASEMVVCGGRKWGRKWLLALLWRGLLLLPLPELLAERERGDGDDERGWAGWSGGS